jgi:hypothetical protein
MKVRSYELRLDFAHVILAKERTKKSTKSYKYS